MVYLTKLSELLKIVYFSKAFHMKVYTKFLYIHIHFYNVNVHVHVLYSSGMLLRFFMNLYDMEVVEEETFLKWKEEVNDQYPGKGKALFQVI